MTLVLAIRCREGIVLASDGQVTADAAGQPTRQTARKLFDAGGRIAWGTAGSAGLRQALSDELGRLDGLPREAGELRRRLASIVVPIQQQAIRDYVPYLDSQPPDLACVFCWCDERGPWILSIPRTGGDHQFHERCVAIGSGDIFAQLAMAPFVRPGVPDLDLERAKMVAYAAIADAIEVAAVYLGPPIQMYAVTREGARPVPRAEIDGRLAGAVGAWRARQRQALLGGPLSAGASRPARAAPRDRPPAPRPA